MRMGNVADDSARDSGTDRPRWPYWAIGLALAGLVIAILVAAFILAARLRPQVGVDRSGSSVANSTQQPVVAPNVPVVAEPTAALATAVPAAASTEVTNQQAVTSAYLRYWDVYNEAIYTLDASRLDQVMADTELARVRQQIADLRSQNHIVKSDVTHNVVVASLNQNEAGVQDQFLDKSILIDGSSKAPLQSPGSGEAETIACQMRLIDGTWKVVSVVRVQQ